MARRFIAGTPPTFDMYSGEKPPEPVYEWVEKARNLLTNPNFVAGSGTVEVRRNVFENPLATSTYRFSAATGQATLGHDGAAVRYTLDTTGIISLGMVAPAVVAGTRYEIRIEARASRPLSTQLRVRGAAGGSLTIGTDWDWHVATIVAGSGGDHQSGFLLPNRAGHAVGDVVQVRRVIISTTPGPFFDPNQSDDPDFASFWAGTPDASESILTGVLVAGVPANRCVAIRSERFGGSMRLIPTDPSNPDCYAEVIIPVEARAQFTALGTVHLDAPLTGTLAPRARRLAAFLPEQSSPQASNVPGSYALRAVFGPQTSIYRLRFYHGGLRGSGDVYWTGGAIIAGDYQGAPFTGDTVSADPNKRYRWLGERNNSESVYEELEEVAP